MARKPIGWLTDQEAAELARLARGKTVLEIGAYAGRSTVVMATTANHVLSVDHHRGSAEHQPGGGAYDERFVDAKTGLFTTYPAFLQNLIEWKVADRVTIMIGKSESVLRFLTAAFEMVFIDGSHDQTSATADAIAARILLRRGAGVIVFHDYGGWGVGEAAREIATGREIARPAGSLGVIRYEP